MQTEARFKEIDFPRRKTLHQVQKESHDNLADVKSRLEEVRHLMERCLEEPVGHEGRKDLNQALELLSGIDLGKLAPVMVEEVKEPTAKSLSSEIERRLGRFIVPDNNRPGQGEPSPVECLKRSARYQQASPVERLLMVAQSNTGKTPVGYSTR